MFKKTAISAGLLTLCGGVLLSAGTHVLAQQTTPSSDLERVTVTGSNIKRTDTETASPVQVLTRQDIEKTGKQSIQEVLRSVTADGQGSISSSFTSGFASGSAAVSMRGLGVNSTLVLVNGRRVATYGLADDGSRSFVDLNSLPLEVVERVEVLKDGGSAVYGADAVGGVVNIILRKNYVGAATGATYGQSSRGDGEKTRGFATVGFGDLDRDRYNVFFSLEASKEKNIMLRDRGFLGWSDLRPLGYFNTTNGELRPYIGAGPTINSPYGVTRQPPLPGSGTRVNVLSCDGNVSADTGLCLFNLNDTQEVQPHIERVNFFGRGTLQFSSSLSAYAEIGYFNNKTKSTGLYSAANDSGVYLPGDPFNPLIIHDIMTLPAAHPDNTFGVDRLLGLRPLDIGPTRQKTDNEVLRLIQGLQGTAFGWDFDIGAAYVRSRLENAQNGFIRYNVMQQALNDGTYRIAFPGVNDPAVLAAIAPTLLNVPVSTVKSIDFRASRDLFNLPGGALGVAIGGETRWESASSPPVPYTDAGEIAGLGYSAFAAKRRVTAVFGEVNAPVVKGVELNGALRYDKYSDFGNSTTPKIGIKYKPIDQLAIRGTYAEAFRAPGPAERGGSSFGFTSYGILSQGNPDIKPEKAKSYTLGVIAEPIPGSSVTLDYWRIDRRNEIIQADPASIIGSTPNDGAPLSQIPGAQPGSFIYYDADGHIGTVTGFYQNATKTKTDGIDVELRHGMKLGAAGRLTGQLTWTHVNKFQRTDADGNSYEYVGTHGPLALSAGGGTPQDRATLSLTWERGAWAVTGAANYVGPMKMIDHKGETSSQDVDPDTSELLGTITNANTGVTYPDAGQYDCGVFHPDGTVFNGCRLPAFTTFDLFAKWTPFKNLDINFSIQNLLDRKAPFDPYLALSYGTNYNQTWHQSGAIGRFFTIGAKYSF